MAPRPGIRERKTLSASVTIIQTPIPLITAFRGRTDRGNRRF